MLLFTSRRWRQSAVTAVTSLSLATASLVSTAGAAEPSFACDPGFYQVISGQLAELDPTTETYNPIGPDYTSYNAIDYRLADGLIYGIAGTSLFRIDSTGARTEIGSLDFPGGSYTGAFGDDGLLHVSRGGREWHKVDVDALTATPVPQFEGNAGMADITNIHGTFYGVSSSGSLYSFDQSNLTRVQIGPVAGLPATSMSYGAAWSTAGGNLYVGRNSGEIYQITGYTTSDPAATLVGRAPATNSNDGGSCSLAPPMAGLNDVDGPESESQPSTPASQQAADDYTDNYAEISAGFTTIEPEPEPEPEPESEPSETFAFEDAGLGTGPSCAVGGDVDRLQRVSTTAIGVDAPTVLYDNSFDGFDDLGDFAILSGSWADLDGSIRQNHVCGHDYSVLLEGASVQDFRWEATFHGTAVNHGGILFHQSSRHTRSGAVMVDLAENGSVVRWGEYDNEGYYTLFGSVSIDAPTAGQSVTLAAEVHGTKTTVSLNGAVVATFASTHDTGHVGLVANQAEVVFETATLTALPTAGA